MSSATNKYQCTHIKVNYAKTVCFLEMHLVSLSLSARGTAATVDVGKFECELTVIVVQE